MAKRGGYGKSEPVEWVKLPQITYGEAVVCAASMGQPVDVWFMDAVAHHLYRCDVLKAQDLYRADMAEWTAGNKPGSPLQTDPKYQVTRPKPEITRRDAGKGSAAGPTPRP